MSRSRSDALCDREAGHCRPRSRRTRGSTFRWGLIRLRQSTPAWRLSPNCDKPVPVSDSRRSLCATPIRATPAAAGHYAIYAPSVAGAATRRRSAPAGTVMVTPGGEHRELDRHARSTAAERCGGAHSRGPRRRRLRGSSDHLRAGRREGGGHRGDGGRHGGQPRVPQHRRRAHHRRQGQRRRWRTTARHNPATTASTFLSVTGGGVTKRVPIVVIGGQAGGGRRGAAAGDRDQQRRALLQGHVAFEVTAAINRAVQSGFARAADSTPARRASSCRSARSSAPST